jgi:4-hydroxy-tetrahydrodipicolinate synthase
MELHGVIPAIITPMDERGEIDLEALERQTAYLSEAGVEGFFVGGTTAEGAYLSTEELRAAFAVVRRISGGRQFLCLASLRASTAMVRAEVEALAELEPDFLVIITPYYLQVSQADILHHYREILKIAPAPVIVYNIPSTTHNPIALETLYELAADPRVVGTKDSSGDFISFSRGVLGHSDSRFAWIQGEDYLHGPSLLLGAQGIVSGLGNVRIGDYVAMYRAARQADWQEVKERQRRINGLYGIIRALEGRTIPAIKTAVSLLGRCQPWLRNRSMSPSAADIKAVEKVLSSLEG